MQRREKALAAISKEKGKAEAVALKSKLRAAALKAKEAAKPLTPERKEKRKAEYMVARNFPETIRKIVKYDKEVRVANEGGANELDEQLLDKAVDEAMRIHNEAWTAYALERDRGTGDGEEREDRACGVREKVVAETYEELKTILLDLLPWMGTMQENANGRNYHAVECIGLKPPQHLEEGQIHWTLLGARLAKGLPASEKLLGARLACMRRNPKFRALEAICAMMATISGRKEKSFLELFGTREDIEDSIKKKPGCKTKGSVRRKEEILKFLEKESHYGRGYFAHYTVKTHATIRITLAPGVPKATPASVLITERVPLFNVLGSENDEDGDAPLRGQAKSWKWCTQPGREFAFQVANFNTEEKDRNCRVAGRDLQPDPELKALILSRKPVVYLEVIASLAPKDVAKQQGHSAIVKAELEMVMREAKSRGEAVVLCLGSDSPHTLAEKVYVREPISNYGLQCGYMRWRASPHVPWAREQKWDGRTCLCLQMP
jgi:hypothetical protein